MRWSWLEYTLIGGHNREGTFYAPALVYAPQIPDFDPTLITTANKQICRATVPTDHIDIAVVRPLNTRDILSPFASYIPYTHALVRGT